MFLLTLGAVGMGCTEAADEEIIRGAVVSGMTPVAFQSVGNMLMIDNGGSMPVNTNLAISAGTLPSQIALPGGGLELGFQGYYDNDFYDYVSGSATNSNGTMQAGTSPSITHNSDGHLALAFHGVNGHLWVSTDGLKNGHDTNAAMMSGTSPSIAYNPADNGNIAVAFQGSNQHLWIGSTPTNGQDTGGKMAIWSSPSIAAQPGTKNVAFAFWGSDGVIYVGKGDIHSGKSIGRSADCSPSIAVDSNGTVYVAYITPSYKISLYTSPASGAPTYTYFAYTAYTRPNVVVPAGGGYQISFLGGDGNLGIIVNGVYSDEGPNFAMDFPPLNN